MAEGLRIVIMEDEGSVRLGLVAFFGERGHEVVGFEGPTGVINYIKDTGYLDVGVFDKGARDKPGVIGHRGGLDVSREMRLFHKYSRIIVFSAETTVGAGGMTPEIARAGADFFFQKPFDIEEMRRCVEEGIPPQPPKMRFWGMSRRDGD